MGFHITEYFMLFLFQAGADAENTGLNGFFSRFTEVLLKQIDPWLVSIEKLTGLTRDITSWLVPLGTVFIITIILMLAGLVFRKISGRSTSPAIEKTESPELKDAEISYEADKPEKGIEPESYDNKDAVVHTAQPLKETVVEKDTSRPAGIFGSIRSGLEKTRKALSEKMDMVFSGGKLDDDQLEELEEILITSDVGVETSMNLIESLKNRRSEIEKPEDLKRIIREEIFSIIDSTEKIQKAGKTPEVIMVVGVNGVGKTTTIGKLASRYVKEGKKVLIVAADTFRAAASEQLTVWADRCGADIVKHRENSDPAAVAFDGMEAAVSRNIDIVMIDTAGRLHTKKNLMEELKKIKRTVSSKIHDAPHRTLMVLDSTTGQNALQQAKLFNESIGISDIALTKLDGTAKGGIVISICHSLKIPISYIGTGEQVDDLRDFDSKEFSDAVV